MRAVFVTLLLASVASGQYYTLSTLAGGGLPVDIPGKSASLSLQGMAVDSAGTVFLANANVILRLDPVTGQLTRFAGTGVRRSSGDDGLALNAQLDLPSSLLFDASGSLYLIDAGNRVRRISHGVIAPIAGVGTSTGFFQGRAGALAFDSAGTLYISDGVTVTKLEGGRLITVAGTGVAPVGTFAGDNAPATATPLAAGSIALDASGNLYICDTYYHRVRKVRDGIITTVAGIAVQGGFMTGGFSGDGGPAEKAALSVPSALAVDSQGALLIADGSRIRKVANGVITTVIQGLTGANQMLFDAAGTMYASEMYRAFKVVNGAPTTLAGLGLLPGITGPADKVVVNGPHGIAAGTKGDVYVASNVDNQILKISGGVVTLMSGPGGFVYPTAVAVDSAGNLYVADYGNQSIRKISGTVTSTIAGTGRGGYNGDNIPATSASLANPTGVAVDTAGNVYVADSANHRIRKISADGTITTVAGNGTFGFSGDNGPATSAQLFEPYGVAVDIVGNLYIADTSNNRIRKVSNGVITTVAGTARMLYDYGGDDGPATSAQLNRPTGVAVDSNGSVYIADTYNGRLRRVTNGIITTVHEGNLPSADKSNEQFDEPFGVAVDAAGNIYVSNSTGASVSVLRPAVAAISSGGVVPVFSTVPVIQPGSWVSIYGTALSPGTAVWNGDFPTSLGGVSVTIGNKPAYLWFVSPGQINLQAPDDTVAGAVSVVVTSPTGTSTSAVTLSPYSPSFSLLSDGVHVAAQIATAGGGYDLAGPSNTFSFAMRPVKAGETLVLYGVGFGPTIPPVPAGKVFLGSASAGSFVTITIGGLPAAVLFSGITQAGLYQFNVVVPNVPGGDQPVRGLINGIPTPFGTMLAVR